MGDLAPFTHFIEEEPEVQRGQVRNWKWNKSKDQGPSPNFSGAHIFANNKETIWVNLNHFVLLSRVHANSLSPTSLFPPPTPKSLELLQVFMQTTFQGSKRS